MFSTKNMAGISFTVHSFNHIFPIHPQIPFHIISGKSNNSEPVSSNPIAILRNISSFRFLVSSHIVYKKQQQLFLFKEQFPNFFPLIITILCISFRLISNKFTCIQRIFPNPVIIDKGKLFIIQIHILQSPIEKILI